MRFMEGVIVGGIIATGAAFMYSNNFNKTNPKKMIRKGKQFVHKLGII